MAAAEDVRRAIVVGGSEWGGGSLGGARSAYRCELGPRGASHGLRLGGSTLQQGLPLGPWGGGLGGCGGGVGSGCLCRAG